jgi:hypothetical protein
VDPAYHDRHAACGAWSGGYPDVTLAQATERAREALHKVRMALVVGNFKACEPGDLVHRL